MSHELPDQHWNQPKLPASETIWRDPADATLRNREQIYQQILDSIADMVLVKGPKSKILWANKAFRDYYGMTNEQLQDIVDAPFNEPDYTLQYIKDDAYVFETGQVLDIPGEPITRHDGEVRLFNTVKSPIRNEKGEVIMTVGVSRDISDIKAAEFARKQALAELEIKVERRTAELNQTVTHLQQEIRDRARILEERQKAEAALQQAKQELEDKVKERTRELQQAISQQKREIVERQLAETALIESERKYRILVETSQDLIWATDREGRFTFVNTAVKNIYGYLPEEMIGRDFADLVIPKQLQKDKEIAERIFAGESFLQYETIHMAKNGNPIHLSFNAIVLRDESGNVLGATGIASDITKRKQAETERDRFFNISVDMMCICGMDGYFKQANPAFETALGYTKAEMLSVPFINFVHPEDVEKTLNEVEKLSTGTITINFENRYRCKDGSYKWLSWKSSPYLQDGLIYAIARDVSDRKANLAALAESEMKFRHLVENANDLIYEHSIDGIFTYLSPQVKEITGFEAEELLGRSFVPLVHSEDLPAAQAFLDRIVATGNKQAGLEVRAKRKDGSWFWITCNISPFKDAEGKIISFQGIARDISTSKLAEIALQNSKQQLKQKARDLQQTLRELQRTQSQLIQSEKMSSLGQLVAGVAHEINNPTSFIYGNLTHAKEYIDDLLAMLQLYQKHYPNPVSQIQAQAEEIDLDFLIEDLPKLVSSMKVGAERIQKIVLSLRTFSRMDEAEVKAVDIHDGLDSTLTILQHRLKAQSTRPAIEVIKEYGNLPEVECYASQLNQVFMNILANGIDALEESHKSWLMGNQQASTNYQLPTIRISTNIKDNWVVISIADNGPGMTESVRQKLFDPFFTTKPVGKGTGMGLSMSYQIITERHRGSLKCISSPGKGAEFKIKIPLKAD